MHEMQTAVTEVGGVCPSWKLSRGPTRLHYAKTAERIKMLFGLNTPGGPRNTVLDSEGRGIRCSLRQITLASCLIRVLLRITMQARLEHPCYTYVMSREYELEAPLNRHVLEATFESSCLTRCRRKASRQTVLRSADRWPY